MNPPTVTIVTPSFNGARFIREAIESVLAQDYPSIEYLVIDGGSTDDTLQILQSYGDRLRWVSEPDRGQSHAINKGFRMATGDIVAWINTDDLLLPGAVRTAVAALQSDPSLGMVYGEGFVLNEDGSVYRRFPYTEPFDLWRLTHYWDSLLQQSVFMRKQAFEAVGGIDESLHWGLDWDLFIRIAKRYPARRLPEDLGAIREHSVTKTSTGGLKRWLELRNIVARHTNRRLTPAALLFGLDTCYKTLTTRFGEKPSGLIGRSLLFAHALISDRVWPWLHDAQGWYENGWASPVVHLAFPRYEGELSLDIEGCVPESRFKPLAQTLRIQVNGTTICKQALPGCRFRLTQTLPSGLPPPEMLLVDLHASRVLGGERSPRGRSRRLCYRLDRVCLRTPQHSFECVPPSVFP